MNLLTSRSRSSASTAAKLPASAAAPASVSNSTAVGSLAEPSRPRNARSRPTHESTAATAVSPSRRMTTPPGSAALDVTGASVAKTRESEDALPGSWNEVPRKRMKRRRTVPRASAGAASCSRRAARVSSSRVCAVSNGRTGARRPRDASSVYATPVASSSKRATGCTRFSTAIETSSPKHAAAVPCVAFEEYKATNSSI
mmetsp:Transcript_27287/g.93807  ORF Transcript_27287/g.93807 Transcript_27287/m.93807 type:complete len:200 (+) Transcript_27287:360-959(+)